MFTKIFGSSSLVFSRIRKAAVAFLVVITISATFPVQFSKAVSIIDGNNSYELYTYSDDAKDIISETDIKLKGTDKLHVNRKSDDMTITISRAFPVTIRIGNKVIKTEFSGGNVKQLLKENGFVPDKHDKINYPLTASVKKNMIINVTDVEYKTSQKTMKVPFSTKKVKTKALVKGKTKVAKKGKNGVKTITYLSKTVNGKLMATSVKSEQITKKPVTKTVMVGTKKYQTSGVYSKSTTQKMIKKSISELPGKNKIKLNSQGIPVKYKKVIKGTASAYCTGTTCSTGVKVKPGYIAVNPKIIPYGTKMFIRTPDGSFIYGYAVAADTGGFAAWGNTIADLYMNSYSQCINFGRRTIEIYFI